MEISTERRMKPNTGWHRVACHFLFSLSLAGTLIPGTLSAQGFGRILGVVTHNGAVVPGAAVRITQEETRFWREVFTNNRGYYDVPHLRPGSYAIAVQAPAFAVSTRPGIVLQVDQSVTVDIQLSQEPSEAPAAAPESQVNTATGTLSHVVDERRIADLPLNGRNAGNLALAATGVSPAPETNVDQSQSKSFPSVVTISTNGARQEQVTYRLDGVSNNDIYTNGNQPFPFPDALQEFSVQTSNYPTRYGGRSGGVINIVTKSGTNQLHGAFFEFNRNAVLNARNFFATGRDPLRRNQFGGVAGGPLTVPRLYHGKDRTFFFVGYQATLVRTTTNNLSAYVPTTANAAGDFSALLDASDPANPSGKTATIYDPLSRAPFPGNRIPAGRLNPASLALLKYLPATAGSGLVFYGQPGAQNFNEVIARVDHAVSQRDRLTGRYFFDQYTKRAYLDLNNYINNITGTTIPVHNGLISETHIFGPDKLNDLRIGVSRERSDRGPTAGSINARDLGVQMYQPSGYKQLVVTVAGYFTIQQWDPAVFTRNHYALADEFSWVRGRHSLAFGGSFIRGQDIIRNHWGEQGSFGFTGDYTGNALASLMLGKLRTFRQGSGEYKDNHLDTFSLHAQDDVHLSRRLTVNLGIRYDPFLPWRETRGRVEQFQPGAYARGETSRVFVNAPPGLFFPGDAGMPPWGVRGAYGNFAPRLGFAYDLTGDGRASLRGGAGVFYDALQAGSTSTRFNDLTPFSVSLTRTDPAGAFDNPYLGLANPFPAPSPPRGDVAFPLPLTAASYDPGNDGRFQTAVNYNWSLSLERQLGAAWLVRAAYVASHANHLREIVQLSPAVYLPGSTAGTDQRRLFPEYAGIGSQSQDINSNYHSLQVSAQRRFLNGLSVQASYTWSKSIDDMPSGSSPVPWYLPGRHQFDKGPSEFDHGQRLTGSFVWSLPGLPRAPRMLRTAAGGWRFNGIFTAQSGGPLTVLAGVDVSRTGLGADRAVLLRSAVYGTGACGSSAPCVDFLSPSAFGLPAPGTWGDIGKGALRGPGLLNCDVGLFKEISLRDRLKFSIRAELFNVLNRVNFGNPNTSIAGAGFGAITSTAGDPRIGQLAAKLLF